MIDDKYLLGVNLTEVEQSIRDVVVKVTQEYSKVEEEITDYFVDFCSDLEESAFID